MCGVKLTSIDLNGCLGTILIIAIVCACAAAVGGLYYAGVFQKHELHLLQIYQVTHQNSFRFDHDLTIFVILAIIYNMFMYLCTKEALSIVF